MQKPGVSEYVLAPTPLAPAADVDLVGVPVKVPLLGRRAGAVADDHARPGFLLETIVPVGREVQARAVG